MAVKAGRSFKDTRNTQSLTNARVFLNEVGIFVFFVEIKYEVKNKSILKLNYRFGVIPTLTSSRILILNTQIHSVGPLFIVQN